MAGKTRVAKYQADRTNQKLYFCRLACQAAANTSDKQLYQAHCETAIFHLYGAYLAFIQELGNFYGLTMTAPTLADIEEALGARTQVSPEVQRLEQLLQQGFLADIERAYQRCLYPVLSENIIDDKVIDDRAGRGTAAAPDLIVNVVTLSNQWLPDEATVREWRQQLLELIEQLRAGMVEF